jgi:hypothetical protein
MKIKLTELRSLIRQTIQEGFMDADTVSHEDVLDTTSSQYDNKGPEELLMHKLFAAKELRSKFMNKSPEEVAHSLGLSDDPAVIDLIDRLMNDLFYS